MVWRDAAMLYTLLRVLEKERQRERKTKYLNKGKS